MDHSTIGRLHIDSHSRGRNRALAAPLPLARSTCAKIRNVMSVLFNHGLRHELLDRNPVQWVRQSAKRKKIPAVLEIEEVKSLLGALEVRERTMVLLDVVTGLRASELFGLKWADIDFIRNEIRVTRSIVLNFSMKVWIVHPGKSLTTQMDITRLYRIETPGKYTVWVERLDQVSGIRVKSNTEYFTANP